MTVKYIPVLITAAFCLPGYTAENNTTAAKKSEADALQTAPKLNIVKVIDFTNTKKTTAVQKAKLTNLLAETQHKTVKHIDFTKSRPASDKDDTVAVKTPKYEGKGYSYTVKGKRYRILSDSHGFVQQGAASWYGSPFHGRKTASGEIYNMNEMTAAHRVLPLGTKVEVTNLANGRKVIVRVNDRGPFHSNRVLDLSRAAAKKLGTLNSGVAQVRIRALR